MLNTKRSKWSLGVILLVALGLLVGLASMATAQNPGDTAAPALKSKRTATAQTSALAPTGAARTEMAVPVPNDECTKAPLVADITAAVNSTTFHEGNHVAIWLPHPLDNLGQQVEPGLNHVRPQDVYQANMNFSTDKPVCDYDEVTPNPGWHERSVWFHYAPEKTGILYLTTYDPMYTRGGEFTTTGSIFRTDYDTVMTVFSTQGGNWCDTWTTMDWAPGVHNGQYDDENYYNTGFVPAGTFPPGSIFTTPNPMTGASFPYTMAGYGSLRERGTNDYFHPGNHFMGSVDCVNFGFNTDQSASAVEVVAGQHYYILVQHYWYPKVTGYCPTDLVLDATFIPHTPTTPFTAAGSADMADAEKIVDARKVALAFASNGRIWDDIVNFDWLANYHPDGINPGAGLLQWAEFAYDPFNAAYFFYDDLAFTKDGDAGPRTAGNRRADAYWIDKNFFNPSAMWDPTATPPTGTDRTDDFTAFGFASRGAISQMRGYAIESQFIADGASWTSPGGSEDKVPMNRWFIGTRALDNEGPQLGQLDALNLLPDASGFAYSVNDVYNGFDFNGGIIGFATGSAAQNDCNTTWPPNDLGYNFLSETGGPVATVALKVPTTAWLDFPVWARSLMYTANLGGSTLSGEVAVHVVNDSIEPLSGLANLGASIVYTYDNDNVSAPCVPTMDNPGDTGPTWSMRQYLAPVLGVAPFKVLAATVGLDDTVNAYDCKNLTWTLTQEGRLVPVNTVSPDNQLNHVGQVDPLVRQSYVIYMITEDGSLWAVRDHVWNAQFGDPTPNGLPDITNAANYELLCANVAGTNYDLRDTEFMAYNATTGELLISLHGTGGRFGTPAESHTSSSKIISFRDWYNTPAGYKGVYIHDPNVLRCPMVPPNPVELVYNHQKISGSPGTHQYLFNFDNTTGFGTNGGVETYPDNFPTNFNKYAVALSAPYQPTWNAGLAVGPTDVITDWANPYENTAHIFAIGGREDYIQEAMSPEDPVQKGGADPNFWMSAIMDFRANPANLSGGDFAWYDPGYSQLNTWAQDLPYTSRCDGFFHGMTGLSYFHDNSRPDVWFTSTGVIPMTPPATTCISDRTCEPMYAFCWLTDVQLTWRSWDFAGTGVAGYDGYLMVYTNPLGVGGATNPDNWTARSIFLDTHPEFGGPAGVPEVPGPDVAHNGKLFDPQSYTYTLPCDMTGEAFIRIVAYDREGNTSFVETKPFRIGLQSVVAMVPTIFGGEVIHRLDPSQKHRVIPVEWTYDPDPCVQGGVANNSTDYECGKLEFDITFDGGYSWQCMHVLNSGDDFSPVTNGTERLAQCIDPNIGQVANTNDHRLDLVIPDYYVDRYPYTHHVAIRMYWRNYGCYYPDDPRHCPNIGRTLISQTPDFSIADELGPTIITNDMPASQYKGGDIVPITWTNKTGIWDPIGKSCDGGVWDTNPVVKAWFSTDRFDNVATTSYDIWLYQGGAPHTMIANGLAGNHTAYNWEIPLDFDLGNYTIRVIGHDSAPAGGNTSYFADTVLPWIRDTQTDFFNSEQSGTFAIVAPACPTITINTPPAGSDFNPGDEVNVTWTVTLPDPGTFTNWVTVTGPCGYDRTFNLANSYFNWAIPFDACPGTYTIVVHAQNGCPTGEVTASVAVTVNDVVPPVVTNVAAPATVNQGGSATITVTATDNVGVTEYFLGITGPNNYSMNYGPQATGSFTWAVPATAKPGFYTATAIAKDAAGNTSEHIHSTAVIQVIDITNPTITLNTPAEATKVEPNDVVNVTWAASDDDAIAYVKVHITGQLEAVYDQTFDSVTTAFNWTVPGNAKPGNFAIQATAYDLAGNHTASNIRNVVIADIVPPVIGNFKANGTCPATADLGSTVSFTFDATDNVGVTSKVITVQGPGYSVTLPGLTWNIPAGAEPGNYIATGKACDAAGNCTEATCFIVVKDGTDPVLSGFTATPGTIIPGGSEAFAWTATDNIGVAAQTLRVTGPGGYDNSWVIPAAARSYSVEYTKLAALGTYTATLTVCDAALNCVNATATFAIADTAAPTVALTAPSSNTLVNVSTPLNITWTANDNVAVVTQWVTITGGSYNQTFNATSSAYTWTTPTMAGDYTIKAYAKDGAGNIGESGSVTVRVRQFPAITVAHKLTSPFRIQLFGSNFQSGCTVTINGTVATNVKFKNGGKLLIKDAGDLCPKGVQVMIQVINPDGGYSNSFGFTK